MSKSLINTLDTLAHLSPDQIVDELSDPFPKWVQGDAVTKELFEKYHEMQIVICNVRSPPSRAEKRHKLGAVSGSSGFHQWRFEDYHGIGTLAQGSPWWFRSKKSYDRNRDEGINR